LLDPSELLDELSSDDVTPEELEESSEALSSDDVLVDVVVVSVLDESLLPVVPELVVPADSSVARYAVSAPVMTMLDAANAAKCLRDRDTRMARDVSGEFFMTRASPNARQGHLSPASNAGQMSL
jgi:hypothetical protein